MILGLLQLKKYNLQIDWKNGYLESRHPTPKGIELPGAQRIRNPYEYNSQLAYNAVVITDKDNELYELVIYIRPDKESDEGYFSVEEKGLDETYLTEKEEKLAQKAQQYKYERLKKDFRDYLRNYYKKYPAYPRYKKQYPVQTTEEIKKRLEDLEGVPEEYYIYPVFRKKIIDKLPDRTPFDYAIELKEGTELKRYLGYYLGVR